MDEISTIANPSATVGSNSGSWESEHELTFCEKTMACVVTCAFGLLFFRYIV